VALFSVATHMLQQEFLRKPIDKLNLLRHYEQAELSTAMQKFYLIS